MKKIIGICPKTNKVESTYYHTIDCRTQDNPSNYVLGLMYACSVVNIDENLCPNCPINPHNNKKQQYKIN